MILIKGFKVILLYLTYYNIRMCTYPCWVQASSPIRKVLHNKQSEFANTLPHCGLANSDSIIWNPDFFTIFSFSICPWSLRLIRKVYISKSHIGTFPVLGSNLHLVHANSFNLEFDYESPSLKPKISSYSYKDFLFRLGILSVVR